MARPIARLADIRLRPESALGLFDRVPCLPSVRGGLGAMARGLGVVRTNSPLFSHADLATQAEAGPDGELAARPVSRGRAGTIRRQEGPDRQLSVALGDWLLS
jgi:hypothetical protein